MKKLITVVGILLAVNVQAEVVERTMMTDYLPVADKEFAYEVKTDKFDKVILDCGGFLGWMTFFKDGKVAHNIYMDTYTDCPQMHEYLSEAKANEKSVCMELEGDSITLLDEAADCL